MSESHAAIGGGDGGGDAGRRDRDIGVVDRFQRFAERRIGVQAFDLLGCRMDGIDRAGEAEFLEQRDEVVGAVIEEFDGMVLNSNGDELMCFFESTLSSVDAGRAILDRLRTFNEEQNALPSPFRLRIGIHTGSSLVDKKRGVAYSEVLDVAGHLQKDADKNGLLISEPTYQALLEKVPFEPAGRLEREQIDTYRMIR